MTTEERTRVHGGTTNLLKGVGGHSTPGEFYGGSSRKDRLRLSNGTPDAAAVVYECGWDNIPWCH